MSMAQSWLENSLGVLAMFGPFNRHTKDGRGEAQVNDYVFVLKSDGKMRMDDSVALVLRIKNKGDTFQDGYMIQLRDLIDGTEHWVDPSLVAKLRPNEVKALGSKAVSS